MLNLQKGSLQPRLSYEGKHTLSDPCFISGLFSSVFIPGLSSGGITLQCRRSGHHQQEAIEFNSESCREFNQSKLWVVQRVQLVETLGTLESSTSGNSGSCREFNQWKLWETVESSTSGNSGSSKRRPLKVLLTNTIYIVNLFINFFS